MFANMAPPYSGVEMPGNMAPPYSGVEMPAPFPGAMDARPMNQSSQITGSVKSWNGSKGYGFITAAGVPGDVMFSRSELPADAKEVRGNFLEGKTVNFELTPGNGGKAQAAKIEVFAKEGDFLAGRIKSFNDRHGYGFITSSMLPGTDVRFNRMDLDGMIPGVPGANVRDQLVIFQTQTTPDGKYRVSKVMFQSNKIAQRLRMMCFGEGMFGPMAMMGPMGGHGYGGKGGFGGGKGFGGNGKGDYASSYGQRPNISVTTTGQRATGVVKSYNASRGFGFITCQGSPVDVFFMRSDLPEVLRGPNVQGCSINFELMRTSDGKLRAANINTF